MLSSQPTSGRKDRYDIRWMYKHRDRCHICGWLIMDGDKFQMAEVIETYTSEGGPQKTVFRAQWHVHCAVESTEQ